MTEIIQLIFKEVIDTKLLITNETDNANNTTLSLTEDISDENINKFENMGRILAFSLIEGIAFPNLLEVDFAFILKSPDESRMNSHINICLPN